MFCRCLCRCLCVCVVFVCLCSCSCVGGFVLVQFAMVFLFV